MAPSMVRLSVCVLLLLVVVTEGAPKAKKVKCQDKWYTNCYHKNLYCPADCLRTCVVDCASCQPVCKLSPPQSPSPPPPSSSPPPPHAAYPPPVPTPPTPTPTPAPHLPQSPPQSPPPPTPPTRNPTPPLPQSPSQSPPPTTSSPPSTSPKQVYCNNKYYPHCYRMAQYCPSACPDQCEVDCVTCSPVCNCNRPGAVCQDPRFIGGDGSTFYFHGKKDQDFCVVSDSNLHINAHFIGKRNQNMRRDFTWVQSLGILFDTHQLFVGAMKTATWNDAVDSLALSFDGQPILLPEGEGTKWQAQGVSITRSEDTNAVVIEVEGNFRIKATVVPITEKDSKIHNYGVTDEDCFAHLDLSFKFYSLSGDVNGVLGQTYGSNYVSRVKMGVVMPVLGGDKDFASSSLFATDCAVARFSGHSNSSDSFEYANLKCASGMDGRGVVCKR